MHGNAVMAGGESLVISLLLVSPPPLGRAVGLGAVVAVVLQQYGVVSVVDGGGGDGSLVDGIGGGNSERMGKTAEGEGAACAPRSMLGSCVCIRGVLYLPRSASCCGARGAGPIRSWGPLHDHAERKHIC